MNTNKELCKTENLLLVVYTALIRGAAGQADFLLAHITEGGYIWYLPIEGHGNSCSVTNMDYLVLQMG